MHLDVFIAMVDSGEFWWIEVWTCQSSVLAASVPKLCTMKPCLHSTTSSARSAGLHSQGARRTVERTLYRSTRSPLTFYFQVAAHASRHVTSCVAVANLSFFTGRVVTPPWLRYLGFHDGPGPAPEIWNVQELPKQFEQRIQLFHIIPNEFKS